MLALVRISGHVPRNLFFRGLFIRLQSPDIPPQVSAIQPHSYSRLPLLFLWLFGQAVSTMPIRLTRIQKMRKIRTQKPAAFATLLFTLLCCTFAKAQSTAPCAYGSNKLICTVPNVFGPTGLGHPGPLEDVGPAIFHDVHFNADFQTSFTALNSAIGTELSLLQLASPASGFTFIFNRSLGIVQQTNESLGPILSERAETIGRHKVYVGVTYQFIPFNSLNGVSLRHIPVVFQHVDTPGTPSAIPTTHTYPSCVNGLSSANSNLCNPVCRLFWERIINPRM